VTGAAKKLDALRAFRAPVDDEVERLANEVQRAPMSMPARRRLRRHAALLNAIDGKIAKRPRSRS
jgi:hypothetical protein